MSRFGKTAAAFAMLALTVTAGVSCAARADTTIIEQKSIRSTPEIFDSTGVMRSNYDKRILDMLDQINLGLSKGWLTAQQGDDFKRWAGDVSKEVDAFRQVGGGIAPRETVDRLERHANCLQWMINHDIHAGSVASTQVSPAI